MNLASRPGVSECKSLLLEHIETRCESDPSSLVGHASFYSLFELAQWLSSNYYSSLFKRPVIKRTEKVRFVACQAIQLSGSTVVI